ncbi:MAG: hypothetical protein LUD72_12620 [Bacteroidales bacterium]|nr:hypothetical protein [Bacteroidales bacterium]
MKSYTVTDPTFHESITITETTDPAHADNVNAAPMQIYENTLWNREHTLDVDYDEDSRTLTFSRG